MSQKTKSRKTEVDWNIWHDTFMDAYEQIDFSVAAKTILYHKSLIFKQHADPYDENAILEQESELRDCVHKEAESAMLQWTRNPKKEEMMNPWSSETGFVRVTVWGPEADTEEHKATVEIQILLHSTIH